jgi:hypothetical protein
LIWLALGGLIAVGLLAVLAAARRRRSVASVPATPPAQPLPDPAPPTEPPIQS